ncbi:hypothetical protein, conserved [Leishmania tarentolae]|uniref:Polycystin cation channel PKD1/PKD2 domain-containing protein n=1 Tax=Leishmania tarentolae TaxID=5689 RepID=A0A640KAE2_LEITA|nr:hypothetical protein, conserved [Leishmania tarentolae]
MLRQFGPSSSSTSLVASSHGSCTYTGNSTPLRSEASTLEPLAVGLGTAQPSALITPVSNALSASAAQESHAAPLVVPWKAPSEDEETFAPAPTVGTDGARMTTVAIAPAGSVGGSAEGEQPLRVPIEYSTTADPAFAAVNTEVVSTWHLWTADEATAGCFVPSPADRSGTPDSRPAMPLSAQRHLQPRRQYSQQPLPTTLPLLPTAVPATHAYQQLHQSDGLRSRVAASLQQPSPLMTSSGAGVSADGRRQRPHPQPTSRASGDDITARSITTTSCCAPSHMVPQSPVALATSSSLGRARLTSVLSVREAESTSVSSPRHYSVPGGGGSPRLNAWQIDEEVAQLSRSLRSEIAGQPFVLTPSLGASPTAPAATISRPLSSYSEFSAVSKGDGGSGGRRFMRRSSRHAASMAAATTTGPWEDLTAAMANTTTASVERGPLALVDSAAWCAATSMDAQGAARSLTASQHRPSKSRQVSVPISQRRPSSARSSRTTQQCFPSVQPHLEVDASLVSSDSDANRGGANSAAALLHSSAPGQQTSAMCPEARPLGMPPTPSSHSSIVTDDVPLRAAKGSRAEMEAATQTTDAQHHPRHFCVAGDRSAPDPCDGFDIGLSDVVELRRRLFTEDFFSSPCRKLSRDGQFPWKLTISVLLCILLLVHVSWYQLPLARANEAMRLAITKQFMGDNAYFSKDQGDIVSAPTAWMESLYVSLEHYVQVYYNLTNASSSEINYRFHSANQSSLCGAGIERASSVVNDGEGDTVGANEGQCRGWRCGSLDWRPPLLWDARAAESPRRFSDSTSASGPCAPQSTTAATASALGNLESSSPYIPVSVIAPVLMRVEVDVFSRREGAQHKRGNLSPLETAAPPRWLSGKTPDEKFGGHAGDSGAQAVTDVENLEHRWLTFFVDADNPLGPFAKHREALRLLRRARRKERHRTAERAKGDTAGPRTGLNSAVANDTAVLPADAGGGSFTEVDAALSVVCRPRYDDLSGRYYRPCTLTQTTAIDDEAGSAAGMPTHIVPEFSLMDNVRRIQLEVTLRHETDEVDSFPSIATATNNGGFSDAKKVAADAKLFSAGNLEAQSAFSLTGRLKSAFAARPSAVFHWRVVKDITVNPGGLVETQLRVNTRVWPLGISGRFWTPHLMAVLLCVLAVLKILLELRALQRIAQYKCRLSLERAAFLKRQRQQASLGAPTRGSAEHGVSKAWMFPIHTASLQPENLNTSTTVYEWGMPASLPSGQPGHCAHSGQVIGDTNAGDRATAQAPVSICPSGVNRANYGTMESRHVDDNHAGGTVSRLETVSPPSLMFDTSLSIIASQHPYSYSRRRCAPRDGAGDASVLLSCPCEGAASLFPLRDVSESQQRSVDSSVHHYTWIPGWLRRPLQGRLAHVLGAPASPQRSAFPKTSFPCTPTHHARTEVGGHMRVGNTPESYPLRPSIDPSGTPVSDVASQASFLPSLHAPLTPQLAERITERSYVDVRTTWRHHLQQSMGAGWHWAAIVGASFTLSYGALLLAPLLPFVEVAQTNAYYAWTSVLLGVASLLSCVLLLSYLRFFPTLYFPVMASLHVVPKLLLFGVCVSPLFLGFTLFSVIAFGAHSNGHFNTLSSASMGLYFSTYGDSLLSTRNVAADTPYTVTAFFASVFVISFVLMFMMIMLNMAMTITQHEWLQLRRRFGAALSTSGSLFAVRRREEVRSDAIEAVRANLEVLWLMLGEEEDEERRRGAAIDDAAATEAPSAA